jgi:hypothetical protein
MRAGFLFVVVAYGGLCCWWLGPRAHDRRPASVGYLMTSPMLRPMETNAPDLLELSPGEYAERGCPAEGGKP